MFWISIHAPREGSDIQTLPRCGRSFGFQSTLPARGATIKSSWVFPMTVISIHAPREGSDGLSGIIRDSSLISIHAPREGSDISGEKKRMRYLISIHAPREGSDDLACGGDFSDFAFQSTLPARGATGVLPPPVKLELYFNPRSPRGERRSGFDFVSLHMSISIHAPREGSDPSRC